MEAAVNTRITQNIHTGTYRKPLEREQKTFTTETGESTGYNKLMLLVERGVKYPGTVKIAEVRELLKAENLDIEDFEDAVLLHMMEEEDDGEFVSDEEIMDILNQ